MKIKIIIIGIGKESNTLDYLGYSNNITTEDLADSYAVSLGVITILMFYLVGIGTILVSTLIPIVYIVRLNPKKIMM